MVFTRRCSMPVLQIVAAALPDEDGTYLPIGVESFRLYRRPGAQVWSHVLVRSNQPANRATLTADLRVFDASDQIVAEAVGLQFKRADRAALLGRAARRSTLRTGCMKSDWRPQPRLDNRFMPDLAALVDRVQPLAASLGAQHGLSIYAELLPQLEALSLTYVVEAFKQLGWTPHVGQRVSAEALAQQLGVIDQQRRLFDRLLEILSEGGQLRRVTDEWEVVREFER